MDCGKERKIYFSQLKYGPYIRCGKCKNLQLIVNPLQKVHGLSRKKDRLYGIWKNMRVRCNNKNSIGYHLYGGRGIKICNEWKDHLPFRNWALKNGYEDNLSIERINNNKGYNPKNCKWATDKEQGRNKRNNTLIKYNGKTQCLSAWVEELGLEYSYVMQRIIKLHWDPIKSFIVPKRIFKKIYERSH